MDIDNIIELNNHPYTRTDKGNVSEFVIDIDQQYTPLLVPTRQNTKIISLLPIEGEEIPFTVNNGNIVFSSVYNGYYVKMIQVPSNVNGSFINSFMGKRIRLSQLRYNMIIDGGHMEIIDNDVFLSSGLTSIDNVIKSFSGIKLQTNVRISSLNFKYGIMFAIFIPVIDFKTENGIIIPEFQIIDMMEYQLGDYSTLYSYIEQEYGISYDSNDYIELVRGQMLNQSLSSVYISTNIDQTVRNPTINYYT